MASSYLGSLPAEHFPNLVALAGEYALADDDERFELLLDIFVSGLARRAAAEPDGRPATGGRPRARVRDDGQ